MASNTGVVLDPADDDPDDWFELYNAGADGGRTSPRTRSPTTATDPAKFVIPNGTVIPAGGFLLVWADEETGQSAPGQLHANFKLAGTGETIGLFTPDGHPVDLVTLRPADRQRQRGPLPRRLRRALRVHGHPFPGPAQRVRHRRTSRPSSAAIGNRTVDEGQTVTFTARATDPDAGQRLTFSLLGAPAGAQIHPTTGVFSWATTETDGPGDYPFVVRVTDNGTPPRWDSESVTVTVREVNQAPTLDPIANPSVNEGERSELPRRRHRSGSPAQGLRFTLNPDAPDGASIGEATGSSPGRRPRTRDPPVTR